MSTELKVIRLETLAKVLEAENCIGQTINEMQAMRQTKFKDPADAEQPRVVQDQVRCTHAMHTIRTQT